MSIREQVLNLSRVYAENLCLHFKVSLSVEQVYGMQCTKMLKLSSIRQINGTRKKYVTDMKG